MIRDYEKGVHETLDVTLNNVGSGKNAIKADSMFSNAFYDFALYSDSGYTTPISISAYETPTTDAYYTNQEIGYTDETVYSEYRILDPTYQTGTIYARFESFGVYTSGEAVGQDYIIITDADYAFTIEPTVFETIIDCTNITADRTITFTQGTGANIRNKVTILNPSAYRAIVTDTTKIYWEEPEETITFWFSVSSLKRNSGWGMIYDDYSNTNISLSISTYIPMWEWDTHYRFMIDNSTTPTYQYNMDGWFNNNANNACSTNDSGASAYLRITWVSSSPDLISSNGAYRTKKIWRWYK